MTSTYFDSIIEDFWNSCISPCTKKWALTLPCLNDCSWSSHHHVIISFFISCPGKTWSHSPGIDGIGFHSIGHVWPLCFHRSRSKRLPDPSATGLVCLAHTARHAAPTRKRRPHRAVLEDASNVHTQAIQQWLQKVIIGISALDRLFRSLQYQVDVGSCHQLFQKVKSLCWGASTVAYVCGMTLSTWFSSSMLYMRVEQKVLERRFLCVSLWVCNEQSRLKFFFWNGES